ncbi:Neuropilin-1 [Thelohanellus kitauei]|uniref:Neuropilin-1 n=1 Tax=Thelohanellus kitauei TaxID=669202 RepID=A0A0C2MP57_THEKT|nr:Neuropilin-1 [Thelohanellus kitauei]
MDEFYIFRESLSPSKIEMFMKKCLFEINCKEPLGMENKAIPDDRISASSSYNLHFPFYARLNLVGVNGDPARTGWCADGKDANPFIDVDLGELKTITGISIQGLGLFDNWVTTFMICYSTNNDGNIFCIKDNGQDKIFNGNDDKNSIVRNYLKYPIATEKLRIKPLSWFGNHLCLRLELFGCSQDLFPDPFDNSGKNDAKLVANEETPRGKIPDNCDRALGISSGELDDLHFSASSELNDQHQPRFARLISDYPIEEISPNSYSSIIKSPRTAWCSGEVNLRQYLEIDLGEIKNVTQIATQGYFSKDYWVSSYRVGYSDDIGPIKWYTEEGVDKVNLVFRSTCF